MKFFAIIAVANAMRLEKWTPMDSKIRDAEDAIIFGAQEQEDLREEGKLTTVSGYNTAYDTQVTKMHSPGDPAMDDHFLKSVFHQHYTLDQTKLEDGKTLKNPQNKVLTKFNLQQASLDVVQKWNHCDLDEAKEYINKNFEKVWQNYDVNNIGQINVSEAYNFEKSLLGSFYVTYSDE